MRLLPYPTDHEQYSPIIGPFNPKNESIFQNNLLAAVDRGKRTSKAQMK